MAEINSSNSSELVFYVNGLKVVEKNPNPEMFLATYLRETLNLKGTKISCGEGGCGSCTILVSKLDERTSTVKHEAKYACMIPICFLNGTSVVTVEALGSTRSTKHELQNCLVEGHGVQCGFCTPGMIMSTYALLKGNPESSDLDIENAIKGNLCRCTGYRPIIDAFKKCAKEVRNCKHGRNCSSNSKHDCNNEETADAKAVWDDRCPVSLEQFQGIAATRDMVFKSEALLLYAPVKRESALTLKRLFPLADIVAGGNSIAYKLKQAPLGSARVLISLSMIREFDEMSIDDDGIRLSANVTISDLESALKKRISIESIGGHSNLINPLLDLCGSIASTQIKNTATICGGLAQGIRGSDVNIFLLAAGCTATLISRMGERQSKVDVGFLNGGGADTTGIQSNEIISGLFIPFHNEKRFFGFYKVSPRRDMSRATLNCGFSVEFDGSSDCAVESCFFSYGGAFDGPMIMSRLEGLLLGKKWKIEILAECLEEVKKDFEEFESKKSDAILAEHSEEDLRFVLFCMQGLFIKFFYKILLKLPALFPGLPRPADDLVTAADWDNRRRGDLHSGAHVYNHEHLVLPQDDLNKPLPHRWAGQSTTGEATFIDDLRSYPGELCLAIVSSTRAHARVVGVDFAEALKAPGVVGFVDHDSVPGSNIVEIFQPRELFASAEVHYVGQPIAAVVARSHEQARRACHLVTVEYEDLPSVITIEDAIRENSFHEFVGERGRSRGDAEGALAGGCEETLEGEVAIGGQEHFYMETNCCRVVPYAEDGGELEVFAGSQFSSSLQEVIAKTVDLPQNKINVRIKRLGGAFGGKELTAYMVVLPCAVAALKFNLPVRCVLSRRQDMQMTGNRRPYKAKYKVGFNRDGRIVAIDAEFFSNDGITSDLTMLMGMTLMNFDGVYDIPNIRARGRCCRTNLPPCAAMRGAGTPQGMMVMESIISDMAIHLNVPPHEIRERNMYRPGCLSLANCPIDSSLGRCYEEAKVCSGFHGLLEKVGRFNASNGYVKQAVCLLPIKFSPCLPPFLNKGSALVNIYRDGSVLLSHGGIESGQGLHTKMIQVASRALGIPASYVDACESSTSVVPNATTTGGSTGSDVNGAAILDACQQIVQRLQPLRDANPSSSWKEIIGLALGEKINLSAVGYWNNTNNENYDWESGRGRLHPYYTYGAAAAHVEVDTLTGSHVIHRVDIVMDVGKSLNPAIDVGQIEGGFVMGLGMCTLEEHRYSPSDGRLETIGTEKYHIPTAGCIPLEMNVTLLKDSINEGTVYSSKGIGEPPLMLSASVWLAIKEAVALVRRERRSVPTSKESAACGRPFAFDVPATAKRILLAMNPPA